jgi:hypothetical protein
MTKTVPIGQIATTTVESPWHTRKMKEVLKNQGQIEPLQVRESLGHYLTFEQDVHATDIVCAAMALRWPTILVTIVKEYQR